MEERYQGSKGMMTTMMLRKIMMMSTRLDDVLRGVT